MNELTLVTGSALIEALHNGETGIVVPQRRDIYLKTVHIAGWIYRYNIEEISEHLADGDKLTLLREPTNKHDELAVKILDKEGEFLGYVPRNHNAVIARLMDIGKEFYAVLAPRESKEYEDPMNCFMRAKLYMRE